MAYIALKTFENKSFGKIIKGQIIPERVLKGMDVQGLTKAKLIKDDTPEKKESKK